MGRQAFRQQMPQQGRAPQRRQLAGPGRRGRGFLPPIQQHQRNHRAAGAQRRQQRRGQDEMGHRLALGHLIAGDEVALGAVDLVGQGQPHLRTDPQSDGLGRRAVQPDRQAVIAKQPLSATR